MHAFIQSLQKSTGWTGPADGNFSDELDHFLQKKLSGDDVTAFLDAMDFLKKTGVYTDLPPEGAASSNPPLPPPSTQNGGEPPLPPPTSCSSDSDFGLGILSFLNAVTYNFITVIWCKVVGGTCHETAKASLLNFMSCHRLAYAVLSGVGLLCSPITFFFILPGEKLPLKKALARGFGGGMVDTAVMALGDLLLFDKLLDPASYGQMFLWGCPLMAAFCAFKTNSGFKSFVIWLAVAAAAGGLYYLAHSG